MVHLRDAEFEATAKLRNQRAYEGSFLFQRVNVAEKQVQFDPADPHGLKSGTEAPVGADLCNGEAAWERWCPQPERYLKANEAVPNDN